ncbi:acetylornithine deacetylase/succinyl-diaminopimelate desuccinylase-like protein [Lewinella marina]|uniref:Acetylornithine deacetylase n=1 Tax=Neolewinella marina TaxID=438751 RepID=A0A2G0CJX3_9BACT|nr:M20/M25/M40 family metallo-hydrolase [Neolewinella marina]NJB84537.1 acetylornithine deacetylase/succinyl-diaminopimelate desuccinylase-like protein [Neolewinella marina]PHL00280.1 acetylornithine deacetylase [Neolewinella marina]
MKVFPILFICLLACPLLGQRPAPTRIDEIGRQYADATFPELIELLSLPNDAHFPADIERNIAWCEAAFARRDFSLQRIETPTVPLLLAQRKVADASKTVLVYLQVDGQPTDTSRWEQENPFLPVIKRRSGAEEAWQIVDAYTPENLLDDDRVFARSASDAKGPIGMFLAALNAVADLGLAPNYNLKVIMDFEEEIGSPRLPAAVERHQELLAADMLIIFDGPLHPSNQPTLKFGARGIADVTLTTYGPIAPQHSGHYGNYAPNPALALAQLLASMKDADGRVLIPGYYDGVQLDDSTRDLLNSVPDDEAEIRDRLQIGRVDSVGRSYQESIQYPSLNIRGMRSGWIDDEVRTIIPAWARAELDLRLVLESNPDRLIQLIHDHIAGQGYHVLDREPTKAERLVHPRIATLTSQVFYQSFRTDFDSEVGQWLQRALTYVHGQQPVMIRMTGGSIPIAPFVVTLDIPAVTVPTVNMDNNQHSPNENLRIGNYRDGVKTMIGILTETL